MAKQRNGINDAYRGTVGTVIGYEWRGQWCLRSRPRRVRNPRTARQREVRGVFGQASHLASVLRGALRHGLHCEAVRLHRTVYNHFLSINAQCFALQGGVLSVQWQSLVLSQGPVAPVGFAGMRADGRHVAVAFERNPRRRAAQADDIVYLVACCPSVGESLLSAPAQRRALSVAIDLPRQWQGRDVQLYGFVEDYAARTSDSSYLGVLCFDGEDTGTPSAAALQQPTAGGAAPRGSRPTD